MKKKITYKLREDLRISMDYDSAEALINTYRASYGKQTSDCITIISVEEPSAEDVRDYNEKQDSMAAYFNRYGTENE